MRPRSILVLMVVALTVAGCQLLDQLDGPQRLVSDLQSRGLPAVIGTDQDASLLGGVATTVCVGDESISTYTFESAGEAVEAARTINPRDPFNIGNAIVEWLGPPRFWLRDRVIVLYIGRDEPLDAALRTILGPPFAETADPGRGLPDLVPPPCF